MLSCPRLSLCRNSDGGLRSLDRLFDDVMGNDTLVPWVVSVTDSVGQARLDVVEKEDAFQVRADMPGLDPAEVTVEVEPKGQLLISGESKKENDEKDSEGKVLRRERSSRKFERRVALGASVDSDNVEAVLDKGVLTVKVPKLKRESTVKKIEVRKA